MKKIYLTIISILLFVAALVLYFFLPLITDFTQLQLNLFLIIVILYLVRTPLVRIIGAITKRKIIQIITTSIFSVAILVFVFWFIAIISPELFLSIFSFLIVAFALTFRNLITNTASGAMILTSEKFEIGDLIETSGTEGIVEEISLNYTEIKEFDGVTVVIPNSSVHKSILTKFSHERAQRIELPTRKKGKKKGRDYRKYVEFFDDLIDEDEKVTRYAKKIEILGSVDAKQLGSLLDDVFKEYKPVFGLEPDFVIDSTTRPNRVRIILHITSKDPELIVNNLDSLLRDIVFKLYHNDVYRGWEKYTQTTIPAETENVEGI